MLQRDIAKKLGVSQTTISLVLNNSKTTRISEEKRNEILKFVRENNYFKSNQNKTRTIGLLLLQHTDLNYKGFSEQYMLGIESSAAQADYRVVVSKYRDDLAFSCASIDGVILHSSWLTAKEMVELTHNMPFVLLNSPVNHREFDMITPDNYGGVSLAMEHLLEQGHGRIGYLGLRLINADPGLNHRERLNGFFNSCRNCGVMIREEYVQLQEIQTPTITASDEAISSILKHWFNLTEPPTAVICSNDTYALQLIRQANILGVKVPDQLSVIGTDNIHAGELGWPALTSIDHNPQEMGRLSFETLLKRIEYPERPPSKSSCVATLKVRESVANLANDEQTRQP